MPRSRPRLAPPSGSSAPLDVAEPLALLVRSIGEGATPEEVERAVLTALAKRHGARSGQRYRLLLAAYPDREDQ